MKVSIKQNIFIGLKFLDSLINRESLKLVDNTSNQFNDQY